MPNSLVLLNVFPGEMQGEFAEINSRSDIPEPYGALFRLKQPEDEPGPIVKRAVIDGDTMLGEHRPERNITVSKDANERDDDYDVDGQYYRLNRLDTHETDADDPEIRKMAEEEHKAAEDFFRTGRQNHPTEWPFIVVHIGEGGFGRPLVEVWRRSDGKNLVDEMYRRFPDRDITYNS